MDTKNLPLTLAEIKKRALVSFVSLFGRQIAIKIIPFVALNIILVRILPLEILGIFNIAMAIITFFSYFSDIGLAPSLIQKKEALTHDDVNTVFTVQQLIVVTLSLIIIFTAPLFGSFYRMDQAGIWLIRVLGISFFFSSLKVIPSVLLERELRFQPLALVEVMETLVFNILLIFLVIKGYGIWSFSIAAVSRGVLGTSLIYLIAPIKPGIGFNKKAILELLHFGVPFQANSVLALLKDRLVPLVVARMITPASFSYITWAQNWAYAPLEIMGITNKITFPVFSRLQENKEALGKALEKSLFVTSLFVYPALFGLGAILPSVIKYIVTSKMSPALPGFYLFAFSTFWAVISSTFTNILNATGYIKTTLRLMVMWTVLTWLLTPLLVYLYGFIGVGLASFIISFTSVATIILVKRILVVKVFDSLYLPVLSSVIMAGVIYLLSNYFIRNGLTLAITIGLGIFLYATLIYFFGKNRLLADLHSLRNA